MSNVAANDLINEVQNSDTLLEALGVQDIGVMELGVGAVVLLVGAAFFAMMNA